MENERSTTTFPQSLTDLFHEIDSFGEDLFTPQGDIEKGEKVIGKIEDSWSRKVYGLWMHYEREVARWKLEQKFSKGGDEEQVGLMLSKAKLLRRIFWFSADGSLGKWSLDIGVRRGWVLVQIPEGKNPLEGLLKFLE